MLKQFSPEFLVPTHEALTLQSTNLRHGPIRSPWYGKSVMLCSLSRSRKEATQPRFFNAHKISQFNHNITYCTDSTLNIATKSRQCNYSLIDLILGYMANLFTLRPWRCRYLESEFYLGSPSTYQSPHLLSFYLALNPQKCCISLVKKSIKFILFCF